VCVYNAHNHTPACTHVWQPHEMLYAICACAHVCLRVCITRSSTPSTEGWMRGNKASARHTDITYSSKSSWIVACYALHVHPPAQTAHKGVEKERTSYVRGRESTNFSRGAQQHLMNFAFEIRTESNPRGSKPPSHTVCDLNHSTNRLYTIGTECSHHM